MTRRNLLIVLLLAAVAAVIVYFLKPCSAGNFGHAGEAGVLPAQESGLRTKPAAKPAAPAGRRSKEENPPSAAAAAREIDTAPPVNLTGSEVIPDIAKCVSTRFPSEAKPHVRLATVRVRVVVDKFGNVRSVKTNSVEFAEEPPDDLQPWLRKLFIEAGNRAFGAKKCPPHVVDGQNVGYAIEVPLQYRH